MFSIAIVGTGYVADLYMRSFETFPDVRIAKVFDIDSARLAAFAGFWDVPTAPSLEDILADQTITLVLNLTNPGSHYEVSDRCLEAGKHVYSEKPLAMKMSDAHALHALAKEKNLLLASAPCSVLSESAQTVWKAVREGQIGKPHLVYAELDDDYVPQAPYDKWMSESGAPWPYKDEFEVGCTLEHAGYYLTWFIAMFGPVKTVVSASANLIADKLEGGLPTAPDFSCATLFFENNVVARLTCSIVAPHKHELRIIGEKGVLEVDECWNNSAPVKLRTRHTIRRKLFNNPFAKRIKLGGSTHKKTSRRGAATMNFALGPMELLNAISENRKPRLDADFALHLNEVTLATQDAGATAGAQIMQTTCAPIDPMPWAIG